MKEQGPQQAAHVYTLLVGDTPHGLTKAGSALGPREAGVGRTIVPPVLVTCRDPQCSSQ